MPCPPRWSVRVGAAPWRVLRRRPAHAGYPRLIPLASLTVASGCLQAGYEAPTQPAGGTKAGNSRKPRWRDEFFAAAPVGREIQRLDVAPYRVRRVIKHDHLEPPGS